MKQSIKQPILKGLAKVPVVIQLEALECGAASLTMILAYYGKWVPLEQVRLDCGVSRDGSNAVNVLKAARHYGLEAKGYRYGVEKLKQEGSYPCIIHWNMTHFVVLRGFKGNKACLNDPARGACQVSMEEFDKAFTGICLMFKPTEAFEPSGQKKNVLDFAKKRLKGSGAAVAFALITGAISSLVGMVNPAFSRVFLDRLLNGKSPEWLGPFLGLLLAFDAVQLLVMACKISCQTRINGKMAAVGNVSYMWKVLHLPMNFFSQRMAGDILERQKTNATISGEIINTFTPLLFRMVTMIFYLCLMLRYSLMLTVIGVSAMVLSTLVSQYIAKCQRNVIRVNMRDSARLNAATMSGISMIETIKAAGAENGYLAKWGGYQANVNEQTVKSRKISLYLGVIPQFVSQAANDIVLILGVWLTMQGQFTAGMVMAFQGFLSNFMEPANEISNVGQTFQEMTTQAERVEDVMNYPEDRVLAESGKGKVQGKLHGAVELKNVCFGYAPLSKPLFEDLNISIQPGESVAFVGGSGCGKSTVAKLISGLVKPWQGEILFDGQRMQEIGEDVFRASVGVVDQDIILFEDTIANNIKMWDESIQDYEMILAARDAQLHEDIMKRPQGYQHKLLENGKDFSGGQRQRMEIARVLAQDPTILILDEATSALDARTEYDVVKAIRRRGITTIVIAHRLSTIRSCDKIIVLDHGVIRDCGNHEQLMESSEIYRSLVQAE